MQQKQPTAPLGRKGGATRVTRRLQRYTATEGASPLLRHPLEPTWLVEAGDAEVSHALTSELYLLDNAPRGW